MRAMLCRAVLLCVLNAQAAVAAPGISGEWLYYGEHGGGVVRIDESSGILEDGRARYLLLEEQGGRRRALRQGGGTPGDTRVLVRAHEDLLLFLGVKNPILVRKGARFQAPREKIRGRWHYAAQTNEAFYYDAEFDLDARKMADISRSESGGLVRSADRPLEILLDAQIECALRSDGAVYHFMRLGADFLVLEPSYAASSRNGYKILLERARPPDAARRTQQKKRDRRM